MSDSTQTKSNQQEALKEIIRDLHSGVPVEQLQKKFKKIIEKTSPEEIAQMENALINEGFPPSEIQRLCDVHVQVFEKSLAKVGKAKKIAGHPINTYILENREAKRILKQIGSLTRRLKRTGTSAKDSDKLNQAMARLMDIETHYVRKENQLFPALEAKNFTGPTQVMWGKHDEIRKLLKSVAELIQEQSWPTVQCEFGRLASSIKKMIFLEEKILFPTAAKKLQDAEWADIKKGEAEIGYAWVKPANLWDANIAARKAVTAESVPVDTEEQHPLISLAEGKMTVEQVSMMLKCLPIDITFVDENNRVCFYSDSKERIFPRSPAIIGRLVENCHPPKSVHVVQEIVNSFRAKQKDVAEFWIQLDEKFIHIRYFPVFDDAGVYRGVVEVSQDASGIRSLSGEKLLLDR